MSTLFRAFDSFCSWRVANWLTDNQYRIRYYNVRHVCERVYACKTFCHNFYFIIRNIRLLLLSMLKKSFMENKMHVIHLFRYSVYQLEDPIVEHIVYLQVYEKRTLGNGSIYWEDLTENSVVKWVKERERECMCVSRLNVRSSIFEAVR